jgi:protein HIRA/HIR1
MSGKEFIVFLFNTTLISRSRNMKTLSAHHAPVPLSPLFLSAGGSPSPNNRVTSIFIRPNGAVVVSLSSGGVYSYDKSLLSWVCISDNWWSTGSDAWNARTRTSSSSSSSQGVLAAIEASVAEVAMTVPNPIANPSIERPPWWNTALTLGHLESRLHACRLLESGSEYKQALLQYVKKVADEGFRGKAEEVLKEYCGPLYWFVDMLTLVLV